MDTSTNTPIVYAVVLFVKAEATTEQNKNEKIFLKLTLSHDGKKL